MKNLIYQVKVGETPAFYDVCTKSVEIYCAMHNIDYKVQTDPILKIKPKRSFRSANALRLGYLPIYEKENAFNYLSEYDNIAIIDADVYIKPTAPNIFNELDGNIFGAVLERDLPLTSNYVNKILNYSEGQYRKLNDVNWKWSKTHGAEFYNMGVMVFNKTISQYLNGETPDKFINRTMFERFVNGEGNWKWSTDQTLLNYWIKKENIPTKNLSWKWNTLFKAVNDSALSEGHFIHFFLSANLPLKGAEIPTIIDNLSLASTIHDHK